MHFVSTFAAAALAALIPAFAQDAPNHYAEPGLYPGRDYVNQHFAEHIDPFTGNLQLHYVDVFLPGNGGFDLKVQRSYNALRVSDDQSAFGRGWDMHFGRVRHLSSQPFCNPSTSTPQSLVLELPDGSQQTFYKSNGVAGTVSGSDFLTANFWKGQCSASGMDVYAPDGTKYEMEEADTSYWHVKRIEDKHGNWAQFTYVTHASSGRKVVSTVNTSDSRNVTFNYSSERLTGVTAEGRTWNYTVSTVSGYRVLDRVTPPAGGPWVYTYFGNQGASAGSYALQRVTYPQGGTIDYQYQYVPFLQAIGAQPATVVSRKTAAGKIWDYDYSPSSGVSDFDETAVTQPDAIGVITYRHYGYNTVAAGDVWKIGLLHEKLLGGSSKKETNTWEKSAAISDEDVSRPGYLKIDTSVWRPLLATRAIARDGATYTTNYSNRDAYGNPQTISETGNRSRTLTYFNSTSKWIVGLPEDESISGVGTITRSYNTIGALTSISRFGVVTSYTYVGDGSVASMTNARSKTTTFTSHYRGVARQESRPEGVTIARTADSFGNVTSETDGISPWGYGYDGINRLNFVNHPTGNDTTITWNTSSRSLSRNPFTEFTDFDDFGRVTSVARNNVTTTITLDALGRKTFESLPGSGSGTTYTLDILGRVESSSSAAGSRSYSYWQNTVSVTNERNFTTQLSYDRYGNPDEGFLTAINPLSQSGAATTMGRDAIGTLYSVTQGGVTRDYGYSSKLFLTSITEPETGTTTFGRDNIGNMTSKTVGGTSIDYAHDDLNRIETITYGGTAGTVSFDYNLRSQVIKVTSPAAQRDFDYDANGNLKQDKLVIDGLTFITDFAHDTIDGLSSVTYPMSKGVVTFNPDAFGRPQQVSPYVTNVDHFGSGNLSALTYANNVLLSFGENSRQLPSSISASSIGISLGFTYDGVGNITAISNTLPGEARGFTYDAIDRLATASGPWGSGSFDYSGHGNLEKQQFGAYQINYNYTSNRLSGITGSKSLAFSYDTKGNIAGNGTNTYDFDNASSLSGVNCSGPTCQVKYQYDGKGQRVSEERDGKKTYFVQAPNGDLLFEYTPIGKVWKKHAYLHGKRVASESDSDATATSTALVAAPAAPQYGNAVTLTATVSPGAATGTVRFLEGTVLIGTATVQSGSAVHSTSALTVGSHPIVAEYDGAANYQPSASSIVTVVVAKRNATVTLSASPASGPLGQQVSLVATVSGSSPSGQVQFKEGAAVLGTVTLSNGSATLATAQLGGGDHAFAAEYLGDANHNPGSAAQTVTISQATPSVSMVISPAASAVGQTVTFQVMVSGQPGFQPTGVVTIKDGAVEIGSGNLAGGSASVYVSSLAVGSHQLSASYGGNANYVPTASSSVTYAVSVAASTTALTVPPEPLFVGQTVTLGATVSGFNPSGSVRFLDNGAEFASATLAGGTASTTRVLTVGAHVFRATYDGDASNTASTSADVVRNVLSDTDARHDFNDDGRSDVFWRDVAGGLAYQWQMNGLTITNQGYLPTVPINWIAAGAGDVGGDGKADVLWRDDTGQNYLWMMNGLTVASEGYLPSVALPWIVAGLGDADGDGRKDVFWRDPSTGANYLWLMNGLTVASQGYLPSVVGTDWEVVGVDDYSGDGKADVLWRNKSTGDNYLWIVDGLTVASQGYLSAVTPTDWEVVGSPDADGDGKADVLWRNKVSGMNYVWLMNGLTILSQGYLPTITDLDWKVVGFGDYDGDGRGDVLWRNAATGANYLWTLNGIAVANQGYLTSITGSNWQVVK